MSTAVFACFAGDKRAFYIRDFPTHEYVKSRKQVSAEFQCVVIYMESQPLNWRHCFAIRWWGLTTHTKRGRRPQRDVTGIHNGVLVPRAATESTQWKQMRHPAIFHHLLRKSSRFPPSSPDHTGTLCCIKQLKKKKKKLLSESNNTGEK